MKALLIYNLTLHEIVQQSNIFHTQSGRYIGLATKRPARKKASGKKALGKKALGKKALNQKSLQQKGLLL